MKKGKSNFNNSYIGPRADILKLIPDKVQDVLDIGCSIGVLGKEIKKERMARVVGVEVSSEMGKIAAERLDEVIIGDIEGPAVKLRLKKDKFDVIIFGDVLEHLLDPWRVLKEVAQHLHPGGIIIASIPNVRHLDTIVNLTFRGQWPYRERGIHDRTHLRFFTLENIKELFGSAGLEIEKIETHYRIIESPHFLNQYAKFLAFPFVKDFLAYQYLIVAHKK